MTTDNIFPIITLTASSPINKTTHLGMATGTNSNTKKSTMFMYPTGELNEYIGPLVEISAEQEKKNVKKSEKQSTVRG